MSAPSKARARLHVIVSTCHFAGVMPAPKPHSDRLGFDRLDRSCHGCRLTSDAAHLLVGAAAVTFSLRCVRASCLPSLRSCPDHVSSRSEAPWYASADAHSSCVPLASMCLLVRAHLDECRVPSPAASTGPSRSRPGGCLGSAERFGGEEAWRLQAGDAVFVPRMAPQRRFVACLERARCIAQRLPCDVSGPWRPHLCVYCWA
ncbi:hypothetical protein OAO87_01340 [bacterium]|nr:hypothetical protein [bacterium]